MIDPKELGNTGYVKPFQHGRLDMENGLITYHETQHTDRVSKPRLKVVPVKFRQVVIPECHVYPLSGHSHDQRTLFRILARFLCLMVNNEEDQFIRACTNYQLVK